MTNEIGSPRLPEISQPWHGSWPQRGLDYSNECPVCRNQDRKMLHASLVDSSFWCAPGLWQLWRCQLCKSGYLDPRPSRDTIGEAYLGYYTHSISASDSISKDLGVLKKVRRAFANGYLNFRFGAKLSHSNAFGVLAALLFVPLRVELNHRHRDLPRLPDGGGRLLDVGCGNGAFLVRAKACGWDVLGVDPDPGAIAAASNHGIDARLGGIEIFADQSELFDVITMSHVIEHVHKPIELLQASFKLLRPGGSIWLETPNLDSLGHRFFGPDWRGLEAPRHLVLFTRDSLKHALAAAGFSTIRERARPNPCENMFRASEIIRKRLPPGSQAQMSLAGKLRIAFAKVIAICRPASREFITFTATKPAFQASLTSSLPALGKAPVNKHAV